MEEWDEEGKQKTVENDKSKRKKLLTEQNQNHTGKIKLQILNSTLSIL